MVECALSLRYAVCNDARSDRARDDPKFMTEDLMARATGRLAFSHAASVSVQRLVVSACAPPP